MKNKSADILTTAIGPMIWGSTYIVTTEFLPPGIPVTVAMLRALPAGILLLLLVRQWPGRDWLARVFVLGALNFSIFWIMLFISAYRLPGGVAATIGAIQPLIVIGLAHLLLNRPVRGQSLAAAAAGFVGVGLLVLTPAATLDMIGIVAGLAGAVSMAFGTVLSRRWQPPVSPLTFTAWQLSAGGILLLPLALVLEPGLPDLSSLNVAGFLYIGLIGGALTYILWFRGVARLDSSVVSSLALLSPAVAVLLGWLILGQDLTALQIGGIALVLFSIWAVHRSESRPM